MSRKVSTSEENSIPVTLDLRKASDTASYGFREMVEANQEHSQNKPFINNHQKIIKRHSVSEDPSELLVGISDMFVKTDLMQKISYSSISHHNDHKKGKWKMVSTSILNKFAPSHNIFMQQLDILRSKKDEANDEQRLDDDFKDTPISSPKTRKKADNPKIQRLRQISMKNQDSWKDKYSSSPHLQEISKIKDKHKLSRLKLKHLCDIIKSDNKGIMSHLKKRRNSCHQRSPRYRLRSSKKTLRATSIDKKEIKLKPCENIFTHKLKDYKMKVRKSSTFRDTQRPKTGFSLKDKIRRNLIKRNKSKLKPNILTSKKIKIKRNLLKDRRSRRNFPRNNNSLPRPLFKNTQKYTVIPNNNEFTGSNEQNALNCVHVQPLRSPPAVNKPQESHKKSLSVQNPKLQMAQIYLQDLLA
ncbi:unnamed protein product [Moneuplotes crassus]|uniref:Uncharacterized protein n=1 Tax=Euplotes crassus TaxID=5936 RepID=A0AAD1UH11_EUPCR|nr:unnamed protein product [Moneuplotes crassus]